MNRKPAVAVAIQDLEPHPAARAWASLGGATPSGLTLLRESTRSKPKLFRLTFDSGPAVYAKCDDPSHQAVERRVYETILPCLPVATAPFRGACLDDDGHAWLFVEDVGERCPSPADPIHRRLAAEWLGALHRTAADLVAREDFPDAGPGRFFAHLAESLVEIRRAFGNRALSASDRQMLNLTLAECEALAARRARIEDACAAFPVTLVHGDFQPKNLRLHLGDDGPVLCAIDWETAGRGIPSSDLARAGTVELNIQVDPAAYGAAMRERWPHLDDAAVERLSIIGHLLKPLDGIFWACSDLRFEDPRCLVRPITSMRRYVAQIRASLAAGAEWLG